jgi:hypothetical protein
MCFFVRCLLDVLLFLLSLSFALSLSFSFALSFALGIQRDEDISPFHLFLRHCILHPFIF